MKPSQIIARLGTFEKIAGQIAKGLAGMPLRWGHGELVAYQPKAKSMGVTLIAKGMAQSQGYRMKRGAKPIGQTYFGKGRYGALYVLECHFTKKGVSK